MRKPILELRLFGHFAATLEGEPLPRLRTRKGYSLLALLALRQGCAVSREWLAGTLWADSEASQAAYNLRQCLSNLRHALGMAADCLQSPTPQTLCLSTEKVWSDVAAYDALIAAGTPAALKQALVLYRGALMEESGEECFALERTVHEQTFLAALEALASFARVENDPAAAVRYLRLLIAADPFRETAYAALMQTLSDCGDIAAVNRVYRDLRLVLHHELNVSHSPEIEALYRRLMALSKQPSPLSLQSRDPSLPPRRLPVPLTQLIGRESEVGAIVSALQASRLVTLTGTGGIGKTRLALAVGEAMTHNLSDGVWFVELAALTDPMRMPYIVAKTLGVIEQAGQSLDEALVAALAHRSPLIILDNAEHLMEDCAALTESLLAFCPGVRLLVTSRQSLGLPGEQVYRVPSLSLPSASTAKSETSDDPMNSAAVKLFVERAGQWKANFQITRQNAPVVVEICQCLDGIPLAIELAAARVRSLSLEEINVRLQDRFALLVDGSRVALPRHQTLRALIDWSYELLTEPERKLLRSLSVFAGGWTLAQAQDICAETAERFEPDRSGDHSSLLDNLTSLIDKSLVIADIQTGTSRYRLLETVRQYASEKLRASGDENTMRRHCDCFLALAEEADSPANIATQGKWLDHLERDYANLQAALMWCHSEEGEDDRETRLINALYTFWHLRGYLHEGRDYLTQGAAKAGRQGDVALQIRLLVKSGALARLQGDFVEAKLVLTQALTLAQASREREMEATSLLLLGSVMLTQRNDAEAVAMMEQALASARRIESLCLQSECLVWLGDAARWRCDYDAAESFYQAGREVALSLDRGWFEACAVGMMAEIALLRGNVQEAVTFARRALSGYVEAGDQTYCALLLDTFAGIALRQDDPVRAVRLLAFVDTLTTNLQTPLPLPEQEKHLRRLAEAQATLAPQTFEAAYVFGSQMDWEQIVTDALCVSDGAGASQ